MKGVLAQTLDQHITAATERGFSGAVLVMKNDDIILKKGYGWTESSRQYRINPSTRFFIASMTKGITGAAAVRAQELKLLSLNDPLSKYFPELRAPKSSITLRQLLTHTSGLPDNYDSFGYTDRDENVEQILSSDLMSEPGSSFAYTGAGYWLVAAVIEITSQTSYEKFVQKEIFDRAGMSDSDFWLNVIDDDASAVAQKMEPFPPGDLQPNWGFRGSGGIVSSVSDLHKWFEAIVRGRILTNVGKDELFDPHITLNSGIVVGLGWFLSVTPRETKELWSRGGESFGHNAVLRWFESERVLVIVLSSVGSMPGMDEEANRTISNELLKFLLPVDSS